MLWALFNVVFSHLLFFLFFTSPSFAVFEGASVWRVFRPQSGRPMILHVYTIIPLWLCYTLLHIWNMQYVAQNPTQTTNSFECEQLTHGDVRFFTLMLMTRFEQTIPPLCDMVQIFFWRPWHTSMDELRMHVLRSGYAENRKFHQKSQFMVYFHSDTFLLSFFSSSFFLEIHFDFLRSTEDTHRFRLH